MKAIGPGTGSVVVALALVLNGCHSHVTLSAPPPTAPHPMRIAAYDKLHSLSYHETQTTIYQWACPPATRERATICSSPTGRACTIRKTSSPSSVPILPPERRPNRASRNE